MKQIHFVTCKLFSFQIIKKKNPNYFKKNKITDYSLLRKTLGN